MAGAVGKIWTRTRTARPDLECARYQAWIDEHHPPRSGGVGERSVWRHRFSTVGEVYRPEWPTPGLEYGMRSGRRAPIDPPARQGAMLPVDLFLPIGELGVVMPGSGAALMTPRPAG